MLDNANFWRWGIMSLPLTFSLIFFAAFAMYFFFGLYVLFLNIHSNLHRVFFLSCISLCFWAFSFSISNSAPDYDTCLFWRRIACLGWGTYFSFLLHFILILTDRSRLLQKKWLYVLLYLPAAANVFAFCLYGEIAVKQYHLSNTDAGWVNILEGTVWDIWFNCYYAIFSIIGVGLIFQWGITAKDRLVRKQSVMMGAAFLFTVLAGTLTDFVINSLSLGTSLQISPIIILLPMLVMLYCVKRYQFMAPVKGSQTAEAGRILSEATRARLYWYLLLAYIAGAFINFAAQYFSGRESLDSALLFSTVILLLGFVLEAIQKMKIRNGYRDILSDILMSVTIPLMIMKYVDSSAVYALTVPFLFVLISVAFNQNRMLILTGTLTLAALLLLWIILPIQSITFDYADHLSRILIFIIMIWIASLINQIYCKRLAQYDEQVKQQELIAEISADFVSADEQNIDYKIKRLLKKCGEYFLADHVYIIFFDNINKEVTLLYEWRNTGIKSFAELIEDAEEDNLPVWLNKDPLDVQRIYITKVEELEESRSEKRWLEDQQINSVLTMLLMEKEEVVGFLGFHAVKDEKILAYSTSNMIQMIGNHVTHSLLKVAAEKELSHMAYFDNLTGAPNRLLFNKRLEDAIEQASRCNRLVGLIYLDLDLFKTVNDIMGHDVGDTFLKQVAQNLSSCLNDDDTLARFGGDEFLIFIPQAVHSDEIINTANRIIEMFSQPIQVEKHEFSVTASMGISFFPMDGDSPEELVRNADLAMYRSKEYGKNRYTVCSEQLKEEFLLKNELTNSLYHALERDELELYYQPKVKSNGEIIGVEALVRWNHPKRGLILPDEFIPIAESIGLISSIDQWVVREACRQSKAWQDKGFLKIKMAFNLSPAQFYRESFIQSIENAIKDNELEPGLLEVEITESIAYYRPEIFMKTLDKLKTLGLSVAIDDFGTDYSSLSRLRSLPIDRIKIDKQFTDEIPHNKKQGDIVKAILALGSILGLKVTVEGVETEQQFEFFKENICDEIQGYYFYKPMPANEIETVLKQ